MIQRLQQELTDAREQIHVLKGPGAPDHRDAKEGRSTAADIKEGGRIEANDEAGIKGNRILMAVSPGLNRAKIDVMSNGNMEGLLPVLLPRDGIQPKVCDSLACEYEDKVIMSSEETLAVNSASVY